MEHSSSDLERSVKEHFLTKIEAQKDQNERVAIAKMVNEFQEKFKVPKVMVIKWLDIKKCKSLFENNNEEQSDVSVYSESVTSRCADRSELSVNSLNMSVSETSSFYSCTATPTGMVIRTLNA